jgi:hypothetical protein
MKIGHALLSLGCVLTLFAGSSGGCSSGAGGTNKGTGGGPEGGAGGGTDTTGGMGGDEPAPEGGNVGQQTTGGSGGTDATPAAGTGGKTPGTGGVGGKTGGTNGTSTGGTPGGTGGVASACGHPICDDFEAYPTGKPPGLPWQQKAQGSAPVNVDSGKAYSGTKSVKIAIPAGDGAEGTFVQSLTALQPATDVWSRMMVFLDGTPGGNSLHWTWMQASGSLSVKSGGKVPLATYGSGGHPATLQTILLGLPQGGGLMDCWNHSNDPVPAGNWACVEWHLDSIGDKQELYINGNKINALSFGLNPGGSSGCINGQTNNQWFVPALATFRFGWTHYHTLSQNRTLYIDDIALDKKRIGCPAAK